MRASPKNKLQLTSAAVLYDRTQAYSKGLQSDFKKAFNKLGGSSSTEQAYSDGDNDFSAQLTAIKDAKPDSSTCPATTPKCQHRPAGPQLGITCPMIGGDGWVSDELKNAGNATRWLLLLRPLLKGRRPPGSQNLREEIQSRLRHRPRQHGRLGLRRCQPAVRRHEPCQHADGKALAAAINSTKDFNAVTGKITIDEKRNAKKPP